MRSMAPYSGDNLSPSTKDHRVGFFGDHEGWEIGVPRRLNGHD